MKEERITSALTQISDDWIEEAAAALEAPGKKKRTGKMIAILVAAALLLLVPAGLLVYGAEEREYRQASGFFAENGLPAEGLTRSQIKAVYKDIVSETFVLDVTLEVFERVCMKDPVAGYEFMNGTPDAETLKRLWQALTEGRGSMSGLFDSQKSEAEINEYRVSDLYVGPGGEERYACKVCRLDGERVLWEKELPFLSMQWTQTDDGIVVLGYTHEWRKGSDYHSYAVKLDHSGEIVYSDCRDRYDFSYEFWQAVFPAQDGAVVCLSVGGKDKERFLIVSSYESDGSVTLYRENAMHDHTTVMGAMRFGSGYLAMLEESGTQNGGELWRIGQDGVAAPFAAFTEEGRAYVLKDMIEHAGRLYLSVTSAPGKGFSSDLRTEYGGLFEYLLGEGEDQRNAPPETLAQLLRSQVEALLLVCTPEGRVETFCSVKGSLAGKLEKTASGEISWCTEQPVSLTYSPYTNSFTFRGHTAITRRRFAADGLVYEENSDTPGVIIA